MKAHKDVTFDIEGGPHLGEFMFGIIYHETGQRSPNIVMPKLKWWQRAWLILNMDIRDVWQLIRKK